jgi:GntR family transcriptional regulator / MocR family aminotransferase
VDLHLALDAGRGSLSRQIYDQIRDAILEGRLRSGDRIPSTRELARTLGISRNTASAAIDHLCGEGFLVGRTGVGTFVSAPSSAGRRRGRPAVSPLQARPVWGRQPAPPDLSADLPEYDFRTGVPDATRFPYSVWRRLTSAALRPSAVGVGMPSDPAGHPALRNAIGRHLGIARGLRIDPSDVVVTNGVQQAVGLVAQVLLHPGDRVAVEHPGYLPVRDALEAAGARIVDVPVDEHGIVVDALPYRAQLVYVSPAHQFPLGVPMSLPRRLALLEWARGADAAVLEDDYDTEFRYAGRPVDPLHTLDAAGRVVYVGSFSKSLLPTLRLGYCVVPPGLTAAFRQAKYVADWHTPVPTQLALSRFIEEGHLVRHVRRMRRIYQHRRDRIAAVLDATWRSVLCRIPTVAGLHMSAWTRADDAAEVEEWVGRARQNGVAVQELTYFAQHHDIRPGLIFGFGAIQADRIDAGLARLRASRPGR